MATLNVSLPDQLKNWIGKQVDNGHYSSASDYLRDLIRADIRSREQAGQWLANQLEPLVKTPSGKFVSVSADDVKKRVRSKMNKD